MQQVTFHIDKPEIEAILSKMALQQNKKINTLIKDIVEDFVYKYSVKQTNKSTEELYKEFQQLTEFNESQQLKISKDIDTSISSSTNWNDLEQFLSENRFDLPTDYKFNRDELYER